jgi:glutamine amidotransferase
VIVIVDYDMGNLGSILNMLKKIGLEARISRDPAVIESADRLILPGVGAFDRGMTGLRELGLTPVLNRKVMEEACPVLGLCLGMQLMTRGSEEGQLAGLGWIDAETRRFRFDPPRPDLKIPHMGWNSVSVRRSELLLSGFDELPRFYFAHSYHVACRDSMDVLGTTQFGFDFASVIGRGNVFGTQFHPEKSHRYGMRLLANFAKLERSVRHQQTAFAPHRSENETGA